MKRFRRILVWVEESAAGRQAISQAAAVARESGAVITLAHCIEPAPRLLNAIYARADELRLALRNEWEQNLAALAHTLRADGLEVTTRLLDGRPFLAFAQEVLREGHDLLVKPAEDSDSGVRLDSTDMHVLRKCPCAVWVTGADEPSDDGILTLVDPDPESHLLNERLLQIGSSLAALRGTDLHVGHVWEAAGVKLLAKQVGREQVAMYEEQAEARARGELAALLDQSGLTLPPERVHVPRGAVREVVPRLVERLDVGLLVLGTVSRTGIRGLLIGNTAETILTRVDRPVLTVKPAQFISPISLEAS